MGELTIEKLTTTILGRFSIPYDLILKKPIRGLPGITAGNLVSALISVETVHEASDLLGYSINPVKQAVRALLGDLFPNRSHPFGKNNGNMLSWRQTLLGTIDHKFCFSCKKIRQKLDFYSNKSRSDGISGECKYCALASSKLRKYYISERTPIWADLEQISAFYSRCPTGYHVDHILPLRGKTVCGLHVLDNLQYLTAEDNLKKHNKYQTYDSRTISNQSLY